jgi:hypothetical protein
LPVDPDNDDDQTGGDDDRGANDAADNDTGRDDRGTNYSADNDPGCHDDGCRRPAARPESDPCVHLGPDPTRVHACLSCGGRRREADAVRSPGPHQRRVQGLSSTRDVKLTEMVNLPIIVEEPLS